MADDDLYFFTGADVAKLRRLLHKVDTANGPGVTNTPESLSINPIFVGSSATGERRISRPFPITLTQTGGSAGSKTTQCSFTYTVEHGVSGEQLGTVVDPTAGDHEWQRPTVGLMLAATSGYAYYNSSNNLVINIINEMLDAAAC